MYKITAIRNTQSNGWVADVLLHPTSILPVSVPVSECSANLLMEYANNDPEHIAIADLRTPEQIEMDILSNEWEETYQSL